MGFGSKKSSGKSKSGKSGESSSGQGGGSSSSSSSQLFPDAPIIHMLLREWDGHDWGNSSDAFADWMNARWKKSGYSLSAETIYEILKCNGRHAFRGIGDHLDGDFQRIFLKLENLQPSGSFKSRGIGFYLSRQLASHPNPQQTHFYSSSGGNAGLACIHAAQALGRGASVVVPLSTSRDMILKLRNAGATEVVQHGASWKDADSYLRSVIIAQDPDGVYVPPFDNEDIWIGNSTIIEEMAAQLENEKPSAVVCSVGGGGLFNGIIMGLDRLCWAEVPVLAIETRGADSLHQSLRAGKLVTLPKITSQATSLGATRVATQTFEFAQRPNVQSAVFDDSEAAMGCLRLAEEANLMVELGCGVNVALCYDARMSKVLGRSVTKDDKIVIILCGGRNVSAKMLAIWEEEFGNV